MGARTCDAGRLANDPVCGIYIEHAYAYRRANIENPIYTNKYHFIRFAIVAN